MARVGVVWIDVKFNTAGLAGGLRGALGNAGAAGGAGLEQGLTNRFSQIANKAHQLGREMSIGLSVPLVGIGKSAANAFLGFDKAMTRITSLVGVNRNQTKAWEADVRDVARTYGQSSTDAAEALYFITSSGIEG